MSKQSEPTDSNINITAKKPNKENVAKYELITDQVYYFTKVLLTKSQAIYETSMAQIYTRSVCWWKKKKEICAYL